MFQATFLFLAQNAHSLHKQGAGGGFMESPFAWPPMHANRQADEPGTSVRQSLMDHDPAWEAGWQEVQAILDEEIAVCP